MARFLSVDEAAVVILVLCVLLAVARWLRQSRIRRAIHLAKKSKLRVE
jgi:ABC-type iron transport system FetAB permease component